MLKLRDPMAQNIRQGEVLPSRIGLGNDLGPPACEGLYHRSRQRPKALTISDIKVGYPNSLGLGFSPKFLRFSPFSVKNRYR